MRAVRVPRTETMPVRTPDPVVGQVVDWIRSGDVVGCVLRAGRAEGRTSALRDIALTLRSTGLPGPLVLATECFPVETTGRYAVLRGLIGSSASAPDFDDLAAPEVLDTVRRLLAEQAGGRPVVIMVDDVHWADAESAALLGELAGGGGRGPARVQAVVLSAPSGVSLSPVLEHLTTIGLTGLQRAGICALLGARAEIVTDRVSAELIRLCAGNPLVLREFLPGVTEEQLRGRVPLPCRPRLGPESLRVFGGPCRELPAATREWVLLLALAGENLAVGLAAARLLGLDIEDLVPAERADLVCTNGGREVTWPTPMTRAALLQTVTLAESVRLSRALVAASDPATDPVDHARHTAGALADLGPARPEVDRAVATLGRAGRLLEAYELTLRAARSAPDDADRRRYQVVAAELCWLAGYPDHALDLLSDPGAVPWEQPGTSAEVVLRWMIQGSHEPWLTSGHVPQEAKDDPARAAHLLGSALLAGWESARTEHLLAIVARMAALPPVTGATRSETVAALADVVAGRSAISPSRLAALQTLSWWLQPSDVVHPKAWPPPLVPVFLGAEVRYALQFEELLRTPFVRAAHSSRSLLLLKLATARAAAGQWQEALRDAREGVAVAEETGQPGMRAELLGVVRWIAAARGATPAGTDRSDDAPSLQSLWIRGLAALSAGHPHEALDQLQELHRGEPMSPHHHMLRRLSTADLVTAAVWAKLPAAADEVMAEFVSWVGEGAAGWARLDLARCRAMLGGDEAEKWHLAAVGQSTGVGRPFSAARARLEFGVWLRRARRHREARAHLRTAEQVFARLEAVSWRDRAHAELRATGETGPLSQEAPPADLTPQEWRIAVMAAEGKSNRQIADVLVLSPRTVGYHLHKVFPKLDITTRAQLARALAALSPPTGRA